MDSLNSVLGSSDHCRNEQTNNELEREIDLPSVENSSAVSSGEIGSSLSTTIEFVEVSPIFSQNTACSNGKEQRVSQAKPLPVCEGEKVFASSVSNCDDLKNSTDANFKKNSSHSNSSQQLTEIETSSTPPQEISKASLSIDAPAFVPRPSGNHNDFIVPTFQTASRPDRKHSSEKAPFFNPPTILKPSLYHQKYTNNFGQMPKRSFASLAGKMKEQPTMNSRTISNRKDANNDMYKKRLIEKVAGLLKNKKFVLIMMRGCPGSGKSTLARSLQFNGVVLSTDDYFMTDNGTYSYDREKLSEAHEWNQRRAQKAFLKRTSPVIIDNTNVKAWEMKSYVDMGVKNGYHVELVEPNTPWKFKPKELARLNSHGVDKMTIQRMVWLYDHNVTVESILGMPLIKKSSTSAKVTAFPKHRKTINCPPDRNHIAAEENLKTTDDKRSIENSDDISRDEPSKSFDEIKSVSTTAEEDDIIVLDSCSLSSDEVARDIAKPVQSAELPDDVSATVALESAGISFEKDDAVIAPVDDFIFDKSKLLAQEGSVRSSFESFVTCEENASLTDAVNVCDESISPDVETNAGATKKEDLPDNISVDPEVKPCLEVDSSEESQADEISLYYDAECDEVCQETNQLDTSSHQILSSSNNTAPGFEVSHESKKPSATDIKATEGSVEIEGEIVSNYSIEQNVTASESDKNDDESSGKKISLIVPTSLGLQLVQQYDDDDSEDDDVIIEEDSTVEIDDISDESHKVDPVEFEIKKDLIEKDRKDTEGENDRDVNYSKQRDAVKDEYGEIATAKEDIEIIEVKRTEIKEDSSLQSDIIVESPVSNENSKNEIWVPEEYFWIEESTSVKSYRDFSEAQYWKGVDETKSQVNEIPESQSDGWATWTHQKTDQKENMNSESPKQRRTPRRKSKRKDEIDLPSGLFQCPSPDWSTLGFQPMTTNASNIIPISSMVDTPVISTKDANVFTAPEDFALVYRILAGKSSNHGLPIVSPSRNLNVAFSDEAYSCNDYPRSPSVCNRATFDKSCSTDDLLIESNESKLIFLKSVFPHITEADLLDLLIKCDSNAEWAVDLLLDSAIEYNDCNPAIRLETSSQIEDLSPSDKMASLPVVSVEGLELMKSSEHSPATPKHNGKLYGQYSRGSTPLRESVDRLTARSHSLDKLQDHRGNVTPERRNSAKHQNIILQPDKVDDYSQEKPSFSGRLPDPCLSSAYHNNAGSVDYKDPGLPRTSGGEFSLELHLDPQTARKLMEFFGPVGFHINPGSLSTEDLCVKMSQSFARQLHRAWSKSIRETFVNEENEINELIQKDGELAQKLQAEEDKLAKLQRLTTSATTKSNITPTLAGVIPLKISSAATSSKSQSGSQFQHIMDEQMALELTKEDYLR
ncbi:uncharacterized protein LOC141905526 isoform X2 [Tubulanus polymorphus]|uniref:uncharacterized protein LOC141905526 isoform X2 n=1 Tax=Tubulanus polymorphus TaxID=672921 RepID=UPI003DA59D6D